MKHKGTFERCLNCAIAQELRPELKPTLQRNHNAAIARRTRDSVYRDLGLIKVKGALGGTYYE